VTCFITGFLCCQFYIQFFIVKVLFWLCEVGWPGCLSVCERIGVCVYVHVAYFNKFEKSGQDRGARHWKAESLSATHKATEQLLGTGAPCMRHLYRYTRIILSLVRSRPRQCELARGPVQRMSIRSVVYCWVRYLHSFIAYINVNNVYQCCLGRRAPSYLADYCVPVSTVPGRQHLRSASRRQLIVPRVRRSTFGARAFAIAGPTVWNSLPDSLRDPAVGPDQFRRDLKTYLFEWHCVSFSALAVFSRNALYKSTFYLLTYLLTYVNVFWLLQIPLLSVLCLSVFL